MTRKSGQGGDSPPDDDPARVEDAHTQDHDELGHLTGRAVLDRLMKIRDESLRAWHTAIRASDSKGVVAQSTSFERVTSAIKHQEQVNAIRAGNMAANGGLVIQIPGFDPSKIEVGDGVAEPDE